MINQRSAVLACFLGLNRCFFDATVVSFLASLTIRGAHLKTWAACETVV